MPHTIRIYALATPSLEDQFYTTEQVSTLIDLAFSTITSS